MPLPRLSVLAADLTAAGVPFTGLQNAGPPYPAGVTIDYSPGATAQQIAQGEAIREAFDYRARRDLTAAQIAAGVSQLTAAQEVALRRRLFARVLIANPADAHDIIAALSIPLAVDEVIP